MLNVDIDILDYVQLSEEDLDLIKTAAYNKLAEKLNKLDASHNGIKLEFQFICKTTICN